VLGTPAPGWTAARVRAAFDSAMRAQVERDLNTEAEVPWQHAAPLAAKERWDHLQHDSGWSVTYMVRDLPASQVRHDLLWRLMAPGRWARRVALFYTPYPAHVAASVVDADLNAAAVRQTAARKAKRGRLAGPATRGQFTQVIAPHGGDPFWANAAGDLLSTLLLATAVSDHNLGGI